MDRDELLRVLVEAVEELQTQSGIEVPDLTPQDKPRELEDFDSLKCLEFEVLLSERLGIEVKHLLIPEENPDAILSLDDVAERILAQTGKQGDASVRR